jgi:SAM-dependent methyltransferase
VWRVIEDDWLARTRDSYDTVASNYADQLRDALDELPFARAALATFAQLVGEAGGGPALDAGCGPGQVTAHLRGLGVDASGLDLSAAMIDTARREHPGIAFEVGSMTDLRHADASLAGVLIWWSLVHVPDEAVPGIFAEVARVLRPGGVLLFGGHHGDTAHLKSQGYGGLPMHVHVHKRSPERIAGWLREAGFTIDAQTVLDPDHRAPGALVFAHRPTTDEP